jgi:hypothetical protein
MLSSLSVNLRMSTGAESFPFSALVIGNSSVVQQTVGVKSMPGFAEKNEVNLVRDLIKKPK